jgi:hypothetical protein
MKLVSIVIVVLVLSGFNTSGAQEKLRFGSRNYVGVLEGQSQTSFQLHTINGFRYKTWFGGVGVGLDYYYERSIPVFFSVNKFFKSSQNSFYIDYNAGINFPWERENYYLAYRGDFFPSLFWAGGVGYKFGLGKRQEALLLNLGYSFKHLKQETEYVQPCFNPPCPVYKETYDYRLKRVSVKIGFML